MGHFECLCYKNVSGVYMLLVSVISKLVPLFSKKMLSSKHRTASNLYQAYIGSFFIRLLSLCFLLLWAPACCSIPFLKLHTWILVIGYLCMQQIAQLNMCFDVPNCNKWLFLEIPQPRHHWLLHAQADVLKYFKLAKFPISYLIPQ